MAKRINIFNRQAVYITSDGASYERAVGILEENHIIYRLKSIGMRNPVLSNLPGRSEKPTGLQSQYIIYVHQDDFSRVKHLLRGIE